MAERAKDHDRAFRPVENNVRELLGRPLVDEELVSPAAFRLYLCALYLSTEPPYETLHHLFIGYGRFVGTHQQAAVIGREDLTL